MFLGIEIGGTKLQVGVGTAESGELVALGRAAVEPSQGAQGIRQQIERMARPWIEKFKVQAVGVGFGGPVDVLAGRTIKSHQVAGWDDFPMAAWCRETFGLPTGIGNDSDMAGLGEARFGAGRGKKVVFYTNVGSGIGGALCMDGRVYLGGSGVASEIGHLRPGIQADSDHATVESMASGWAIGAAGRADAVLAKKLCSQHACTTEQITGKMVADAALAGDPSAVTIFRHATQVYGWAIAQMITLLAPEAVVIGGGVPLVGEELFFTPLRKQIETYVFPPLHGTYTILPALLGEEVVVHGALALGKAQCEPGGTAGLFIP